MKRLKSLGLPTGAFLNKTYGIIKHMYNPNLNQDQEAQLIANEMLAAAKEERQQKLAARRVARIIKIIATIIVIVAIVVVMRPLFSAETARDKKRKESLSEISKEISSYKSNHRNNLPMETSTKQWEREFIEPYLKDKELRDRKSVV